MAILLRFACCISKATLAHAHTFVRAPTHTHTHTHREICNIYCFSTATVIPEHASVLGSTYIACLILSSCSEVVI